MMFQFLIWSWEETEETGLGRLGVNYGGESDDQSLPDSVRSDLEESSGNQGINEKICKAGPQCIL